MASLNSGIGTSDNVISGLADQSIKALQIKIDGESFSLGNTSSAGTWELAVKDIQAWLQGPQYILIKLAHPKTASQWTLLQFTPDSASVRDKMMYSSSKTLLLKSIPVDQKDLFQVFATDASELSAHGLDEFAKSSEAPNPLSEREKEKQQHQYQEASAAIGLSTRASNASNLQFEITQQAVQAIKSAFVSGAGAVGLGIQDEKTVLVVEQKDLESLQDLVRICPKEAALFLFFKLASKDIGFAYVSPPSCKIKDRMLFAASRQTVISQVEALLSVTIKKKYEVDSVEEVLEEDYEQEKTLSNQAAGYGSASKLLFARPKRPGK